MLFQAVPFPACPAWRLAHAPESAVTQSPACGADFDASMHRAAHAPSQRRRRWDDEMGDRPRGLPNLSWGGAPPSKRA